MLFLHDAVMNDCIDEGDDKVHKTLFGWIFRVVGVKEKNFADSFISKDDGNMHVKLWAGLIVCQQRTSSHNF